MANRPTLSHSRSTPPPWFLIHTNPGPALSVFPPVPAVSFRLKKDDPELDGLGGRGRKHLWSSLTVRFVRQLRISKTMNSKGTGLTDKDRDSLAGRPHRPPYPYRHVRSNNSLFVSFRSVAQTHNGQRSVLVRVAMGEEGKTDLRSGYPNLDGSLYPDDSVSAAAVVAAAAAVDRTSH
jgi:hypothetical protein